MDNEKLLTTNPRNPKSDIRNPGFRYPKSDLK